MDRDLTRRGYDAAVTAAHPTIADEVERYLRSGDSDSDRAAWLGGFGERAARAHADIRGGLVREVRRLANIVKDAAASRSGWKLILARCAPTSGPRIDR